MASELIGSISKLYDFVKKQKNIKKDVMFQYNTLKIILTNIMDGLQSYSNLSLEGESQTILCLKEQIANAQEQVMDVEERNKTPLQWILRFRKSSQYIDDLKESIKLLELAHESLIDQIDLANAGAVRSQNIHYDKLNQDVLELFNNSQDGLLFWRDHVLEKTYNLPASKCANYFIEFVNTHNAKIAHQKRINVENIDLIIQQLFDRDKDGKISINEIASFFTKVWDNETVRLKINDLNNDRHKFDELEYKLLGQLCEEVNQKNILRIFKMNSFTSIQFLSIDYQSFLEIYKSQIDKKTLSSIFQKKLEYQTQRQFYEKLVDGCNNVYKKAVKVSQTIMDAKSAGKLKFIEKGNSKYWIEDPKNGNGMCFLIKGDAVYISYRYNWLCFSEPAKIINLKSKVTVFALLNEESDWEQGYLINRFSSGTIFYCYIGFDTIRKQQYQLVKSIRGEEMFMGLQYQDPETKRYEKEGEFIFIRNDMMQYKDYYKEGKLVDWNEYKKIGLEHQLNISELKQIQTYIID